MPYTLGDRKGELRSAPPPSFRAEALPRAGSKQEAATAVLSGSRCRLAPALC